MNEEELYKRINNKESFILASDGQYLGRLCLNICAPESILNRYGLYGNPYSATSINNKYSIYGSQYSSLSPFNPFTQTPPIIYLRGAKFGFLSVNKYLLNSVHPLQIQDWMRTNRLFY